MWFPSHRAACYREEMPGSPFILPSTHPTPSSCLQAAELASGHVWALLSTCFCFCFCRRPEVPWSPGESERSSPSFLVQSLSLHRGNKVVRTDEGERKHPRERIQRKAPTRSRTKCESSVLPSLENRKDLDPRYFPFFPDKENVLLLRRSVPSS